jgi:CRP-like cAMP-binding protein
LAAALEAPELERLARGLQPAAVPAASVVFEQGEPGDRFYVVADGELDVLEDGRRVSELGRGDAFGEIALLHQRPRTASVRARSNSSLYALERDDFLAAVAAGSGFGEEAHRLARARLERSARLAADVEGSR